MTTSKFHDDDEFGKIVDSILLSDDECKSCAMIYKENCPKCKEWKCSFCEFFLNNPDVNVRVCDGCRDKKNVTISRHT